jgi:3-deoxy-7-phosphoheptulonate synthase
MMKTGDLRISGVRRYCRLRSWLEIPVTTRSGERITLARVTIEAILDGRDARLLAVVGPCSIHDIGAALADADFWPDAAAVRTRLIGVGSNNA